MLMIAAAAASPLSARGQQPALPIVAYLSAGTAAGRERFIEAFRSGLAEGGYVGGRNVTIEHHWAGDDYDRLLRMAAELARRDVAVIIATNLAAALAARRATSTIPIVFLAGDDPIKHGLVTSLNHPGGNATGVSILVASLAAKRLDLLRELVPGGGLFALLVNPKNSNLVSEVSQVEEAARSMGQHIDIFKAGTTSELETAFTSLAHAGVKGVLVGADPFFNSHRAQIVELAARYAVAGIYEWREFVVEGGLASYGPDLADAVRQFGTYAGRVLKGEQPSDLPVLQPTTLGLVINLKTAKALGLTVPQSLLVVAGEVIE